MYTVYFMFFQVASATATRYGLSRGLLGLKYDQINYSDSDSASESTFSEPFYIGKYGSTRSTWLCLPELWIV